MSSSEDKLRQIRTNISESSANNKELSTEEKLIINKNNLRPVFIKIIDRLSKGTKKFKIPIKLYQDAIVILSEIKEYNDLKSTGIIFKERIGTLPTANISSAKDFFFQLYKSIYILNMMHLNLLM